MFDSIKINKEATLIIIFMNEKVEKRPQSFRILDQTIPISSDKFNYIINLKDKSLNDNKIYECFLQYESEKISCFLKVNYGQDNYYFFGLKKNNKSFEFIFADFASKMIDNNRCYIKYNGENYFAFDDKNFSKLRCLNLINIDLKLLELPVSYKNKVIPYSIFDDSSYFIFVSVAEGIRKILGIFLNKPFIEKEQKLSGKQIVELLTPSLINVQRVLNYDKNKTFVHYYDGIKLKEVSTIYKEELSKSMKLEEEIVPFFNFYRANLTEEDILAFETYSNFMITFPNFPNMGRDNPKLNTFKYTKQYYYSHKAIENFKKTIPSEVNRVERTFLIYSACRCLRSLLSNGYTLFEEDLFYFYDLNKPNTIYNEAKRFNEIFIDNLTENSEMFLFLLQINSGSSVNKLTNDLTTRISMLKIEQIKEHLRNSLPNYVIRMKNVHNIKGITFTEAKCTIVDEVDLFGSFLDDRELKGGETDEKYNKRLILSNFLQHERFGHIKFSMNFYCFKQDKGNNLEDELGYEDELSSPRQFYQIKYEENKIKENLIEIVEILQYKSGKKVEKGESGLAFNVFLTRGDEKNIKILRDIEADFSEIFKHPELFAAEDLTTLNMLIKETAPESQSTSLQFQKVSEEKFELKREKILYLDLLPTTAKYSS